ncbi:MAG TPA: ATP-binding protein [Streptosporangiaceae bacterium]|nr:ATP-binding protein [Streptosporangiaceae bacterium]
MTDESMFPPYIPRLQEHQIQDAMERVRADGSTGAILLYGAGGVGKTQMVRKLATTFMADPLLAALSPIDLDDAEYWLLSNLEQRVIEQLDPDNRYFDPYLTYLRRLPGHTIDRIDRETVVSHLDAVKQIFVNCYTKFIQETGKTVVIIFDTIEVIRGVSLLYTLTDWMKSLPATLFILSGRPLSTDEHGIDPIQRELRQGQQGMPVEIITLGVFSWEAALDFLNLSKIAEDLTDEEKAKLVLLTRGHPLWLAFTISYLRDVGIPQEAEVGIAELERNLPFGRPMTRDGQLLNERYKGQLVTPYKHTDFQHESIKRLAVVRQNVSQAIWERLMADRVQQDDISSLASEWEDLISTPWIRARTSGEYVTLHDAVAEELSLLIIPAHDRDQSWRRDLWHRAAEIYSALSQERQSDLEVEQNRLDDRLRSLSEHDRQLLDGRADGQMPDGDGSSLVADIARLDGWERRVNEFRAVSLHYKLLSDFEEGASAFLELFEESRKTGDPLWQERLAVEIQRFLPSPHQPTEDVVGQVISAYRGWLETVGMPYYERIAEMLAQYQIGREQQQLANETLGELPARATNPERRFHLNIIKGNALMRIPGQSAAARRFFDIALTEAQAMTSSDAILFQARAHKELGFYFRHQGHWRSAAESYKDARDLILARMLAGSTDEDRKELASIDRNWAYIKGISGDVGAGMNLIESVIKVYKRFGMLPEEAQARSVQGEINRYGWRFAEAWQAYHEAIQILEALRNRAWLGLIYQEQAICLAQAHRNGLDLVPDPRREAKRLIVLSLEICREQNVRAYPSALNRAARIFGAEDIDNGLEYAAQGIEWGYRLSDGWKWTACLVEYVELSYQGWVATGDDKYRDYIRQYARQVELATEQTDFVDLRGKWNLLQGHLKIRDWMRDGDETWLDTAVDNYRIGFADIANTFIGSSSSFTLGREFERFNRLFSGLPEEVRAKWLTEFRMAWSGPTASEVLIARLEELY